MRIHHIILFFLFILFVTACGRYADEGAKDTATSGRINIAADEELKPMTRAELDVFTSLYTNAKINAVYKPEDSAYAIFLKDSARLIVTSRKLTSSEETYLNNNHLHPEQVKIASDAIVFIVNNANPDTLLSVEKLKAIFNGNDSLWQQINTKNKGKINLVFDYDNSGISRYIQQNLMQEKKFPAYCFALQGNKQVVQYVSKNPGAIGVLAFNWLSSEYDTAVINALKMVKVVALSAKESPNASDYFAPYMATIQSGQYPICRDIYIISREPYTGLGSGFLSFVASNKGQRIIYQEGLLPARMPSLNIHY